MENTQLIEKKAVEDHLVCNETQFKKKDTIHVHAVYHVLSKNNFYPPDEIRLEITDCTKLFYVNSFEDFLLI